MRSVDRYNVSFSRVSSASNEKNTFNAKVCWIDELVIEVYSLQPACPLSLMMAKRCQTHCGDNWWQTNWLLHFVWGEILARFTSATGEELLIGATVMEQLSMNGVDVTSICTMAHWGGRSWSTAEMNEMQRAATTVKAVTSPGRVVGSGYGSIWNLQSLRRFIHSMNRQTLYIESRCKWNICDEAMIEMLCSKNGILDEHGWNSLLRSWP